METTTYTNASCSNTLVMSKAVELHKMAIASQSECLIPQDHFMHRMNVERVDYTKIFRDIRLHVSNCLKIYSSAGNDCDAKFYELFESLQFLVESTQEHQEILVEGCSKYDFVNSDGSVVKANGFRSALFLLSSCLQSLLGGLERAMKQRTKMFYSPANHLKSLFVHCRALQACEIILRYGVKLMEVQPPPQLFSDGELSQLLVKVLFSEYLSADVFYGKCLGIQYAPSLKLVLRMICLGMTSYEEWYLADKSKRVRGVLRSIWKGKKYFQSTTRMGLKFDSLTNSCSVDFVKAYWSLLEKDTVTGAMKLVAQSVEIRQWLEVPAKPLKMEGTLGEVEVKPPCSDAEYKPIRLLLISYKWRNGQLQLAVQLEEPESEIEMPRSHRSHFLRRNPFPLSTGLVVHMHGGGYVAQSPKSHELYLRKWSCELDVPIVSIDYSLSPECPYPTALEECLLAYTWMLQNLEKLGTIGERIVFAGDSAGGNFAISVAMKLKQLGLRLPNAILSVYPSLNCKSSGSPSRLTGIVDPILPLGVMLACKEAYTGMSPSTEIHTMRKENHLKILKAQGYYLPNPDVWTSSQHYIRWSNSGTCRGNKVNNLMEGSNLEVTTDTENLVRQEQTQHKTDESCTVHPQLPVTSRQRQEPDENDKLSPAELESLIDELVRSYDDPEIVNDPFMSPLLAPAELLKGLPPIHLVGAALDPILDDVVAMAHKLKSVDQPVTLNVFDNLPHGFLCLVSAGNNGDVTNAQRLCVKYIKNELETY